MKKNEHRTKSPIVKILISVLLVSFSYSPKVFADDDDPLLDSSAEKPPFEIQPGHIWVGAGVLAFGVGSYMTLTARKNKKKCKNDDARNSCSDYDSQSAIGTVLAFGGRSSVALGGLSLFFEPTDEGTDSGGDSGAQNHLIGGKIGFVANF